MNYTVIPATDSTPEVIMADMGNGTALCIPTDPANSDYQAYLASQTDQ